VLLCEFGLSVCPAPSCVLCSSNAELKATLMSSLEATAAAKRAAGRKLEPDDLPDARYEMFRELSARCGVGALLLFRC
jgi:hypothetical protein